MKTVLMQTVEQRQWRHSGVFIVKCEHVSHFALIMTLNKRLLGSY